MHTIIVTAKVNDVDPQTWLADVLVRIAVPHNRVHELLPWNWKAAGDQAQAGGPVLTSRRIFESAGSRGGPHVPRSSSDACSGSTTLRSRRADQF